MERNALLGLGGAALVLLALPRLLDAYYLGVLASALALAIACLGVNLLLGSTGLLSLGHAAYFGMGAYVGGFLFTFGDVRSFELYVVAGVLGAAVLAALVGSACVRSTRIFFTILTLAYAQVVHSVFVSGAVFRLFGERGKGVYYLYEGGLYLPHFAIAGRTFSPATARLVLYHAVVVAFLAAALVCWRVAHSPFGLALRAIRDNETRAAHVGIRVRRTRWRAFIVSGAVAGLGGALAGQLHRQVTTQQLDWILSAELVIACVLGGSRVFAGPIVGALVVVALEEVASRFALHHDLLLGLMLVAVVSLLPGGVLAGAERAAAWLAGRNFSRAR